MRSFFLIRATVRLVALLVVLAASAHASRGHSRLPPPGSAPCAAR